MQPRAYLYKYEFHGFLSRQEQMVNEPFNTVFFHTESHKRNAKLYVCTKL